MECRRVLFRALTSPTTVSGEDVVDYNRFDPIADQAVRRDMEIVTDPNRILIRTERFRALGALQAGVPDIGEIVPDRFDIRCYAIRNLRSAAHTSELQSLMRNSSDALCCKN